MLFRDIVKPPIAANARLGCTRKVPVCTIVRFGLSELAGCSLADIFNHQVLGGGCRQFPKDDHPGLLK